MEKENENLRKIVIQGWAGMLFLLIVMVITDLVKYGMSGDFSPLIKDPGMRGLWFIATVTCISVLVQMFLRTYDDKRCRWSFFAVTLAYTLIFIAHQLIHLFSGDGFDIHFVLDVTHHILGIWATIAAYKWVKLGVLAKVRAY